jgi:hypothetical protein
MRGENRTKATKEGMKKKENPRFIHPFNNLISFFFSLKNLPPEKKKKKNVKTQKILTFARPILKMTAVMLKTLGV